ncbi:nitrous oxide reductase accessory protein NosL [Consotaella salsifontis]|uniref:Copper chaperone NosL n=1 Tax=Consotaella salsifontis TaxID=1365950 RepID=A0A1T4SVU7_9HYPH|nr:nitrous oxide reductase accessory protein NosL [Consotaella salsifontis]SKA32021.1 copper chaperone NosL [Consotaella salsifontis]
MKKLLAALVLATALAGPLSGCSEESAAKPVPITMTEEAVGHYCQMDVIDHAGPKAQIHLAGMEKPLWFSQVSDAVAYLHDPEREAEVRAVYVTDMAKAPSWGDPGADNWTDADSAVFVIDSRQSGGMGTPEAIPFAEKPDAEAFVREKGGRIVTLTEIPEAYVRSARDASATEDAGAGAEPAGM